MICRTIATVDIPAVVALLTDGYRDQRDRSFWERALARLVARPAIEGCPRFGYLLETDGAVVGVILLIFAHVPSPCGVVLRCNLSSWYVAEPFRTFGSMLITRALRHREATYLNITPAPHTWPILAAPGFVRFCEGRVLALPILSLRGRGTVVSAATAEPGNDIDSAEIALLRDHAAWGCISVVCIEGGRRCPFVFAPRIRAGIVGLAVLTYCRDLADFERCAGPLGRYLARRGFPLVVVDSNGPLAGVPGRYQAMRPKYYRGANRPRLGDAAFTERAVFGS